MATIECEYSTAYIDGCTEQDAISVEANRRCYLGRGSQNVLSRPRLTEDDISDEADETCYLRRCFFCKFFSGSSAYFD